MGDQLVEGVVARGGDGEIEGAVEAADRVGRLEVDDAVRNPQARRQARFERHHLDLGMLRKLRERALYGLIELRALAERDQRVGAVGVEPELLLGRPPLQQLTGIEVDDRATFVAPCRPAVSP